MRYGGMVSCKQVWIVSDALFLMQMKRVNLELEMLWNGCGDEWRCLGSASGLDL